MMSEACAVQFIHNLSWYWQGWRVLGAELCIFACSRSLESFDNPHICCEGHCLVRMLPSLPPNAVGDKRAPKGARGARKREVDMWGRARGGGGGLTAATAFGVTPGGGWWLHHHPLHPHEACPAEPGGQHGWMLLVLPANGTTHPLVPHPPCSDTSGPEAEVSILGVGPSPGGPSSTKFPLLGSTSM